MQSTEVPALVQPMERTPSFTGWAIDRDYRPDVEAALPFARAILQTLSADDN